jgi:hypothetical protein
MAWKRWYERNKGNKSMQEKNHARYIANVEHEENHKCSIEGCNNIGERHHHDYNKPTDIVWLCHKHHGMVHKSDRECDVIGCHNKHRARGLCNKHWVAWSRVGKPDIKQYLESEGKK